MGLLSTLNYATLGVLTIVSIAVGIVSTVAFVHCAVTRPDAYPAADRQSKVLWLVLLGLSVVAAWFFTLFSLPSILGIIITLIYLVDIRPRVDHLTGKRWFRRN